MIIEQPGLQKFTDLPKFSLILWESHSIAQPKLDHLSEKCWRLLPFFTSIMYVIKTAPFQTSLICSCLMLPSLLSSYTHFKYNIVFGKKNVKKIVGHINGKVKRFCCLKRMLCVVYGSFFVLFCKYVKILLVCNIASF